MQRRVIRSLFERGYRGVTVAPEDEAEPRLRRAPTGEDLGGLCREHRGVLAGRRRRERVDGRFAQQADAVAPLPPRGGRRSPRPRRAASGDGGSARRQGREPARLGGQHLGAEEEDRRRRRRPDRGDEAVGGVEVGRDDEQAVRRCRRSPLPARRGRRAASASVPSARGRRSRSPARRLRPRPARRGWRRGRGRRRPDRSPRAAASPRRAPNDSLRSTRPSRSRSRRAAATACGPAAASAGAVEGRQRPFGDGDGAAGVENERQPAAVVDRRGARQRQVAGESGAAFDLQVALAPPRTMPHRAHQPVRRR